MKTTSRTNASQRESARPDKNTPRNSTLLLRLLLFLVPLGTLPASQAADSGPPDRLTYQAFLVDANGTALGDTAPRNYDVVFRIWKDASSTAAGDRVWTEQQTVTVDKGYFSVLLGEGAAVGSEARPSLAGIFAGPDASDRYVEMTVKGVGAGGGDSTIAPRLRLLTGPYAFLARHASQLVNDTGSVLVTSSGSTVTVAGTLAATSLSGNGSSLTGLGSSQIPDLDASKINSGTFDSGRIPNLDASKLTAGTLNSARIPNLDASKINSGTLDSARIPNLDASKLTSGTLGTDIMKNLRLTDAPLYFRGGTDTAHGVGFFGTGFSLFNGLNVDGPVLFGYGGGALGTRQGTTEKAALRWDGNGKVGIYTVNGQAFEVYEDVARIYNSSDKNKSAMWFRNSLAMVFRTVGATGQNTSNREVSYDGDSNWDFGSDRRLKTNIVDAENVLNRVMAVRMRRFRWIGGKPDATPELGVIAQEFQPLFPELVGRMDPDASQPACPDGVMTVGLTSLGTIALKAIQELKQEKDAEITALKRENAAFKQQIEALHGTAASLASLRQEMSALKELVSRSATLSGREANAGRTAFANGVTSVATE